MEKQLVNAFDQVTMPDSCVKKIENSLNPAPQATGRYTARPMAVSRHGWLAPAAALLALVFMVGLMGGMNTEPEQLAEAPVETAAPMETQAGTIQEGEITEGRTWEFEDGAVTVTKGHRPGQGGFSEGSYDTGHVPTWLIEQDGRLFFAPEGVRGMKDDITDLISMEEPYTYIYTDEDGIIRYLAVGMLHDGSFVSIEESLGWACWFRNAAEMEAALAEGKADFHAGWLTGYGRGHWNNEKDEAFGWYTKAKEIMEIPWG